MRPDPALAAPAARRALARSAFHVVPGAPPAGLAEALAGIPPGDVPSIRMRGPAAAAGEALAERLAGSALPEGVRRALARDVATLGRLAAAVGRRQEVSVRFEAITGDGCRLFHRDAVPLRLATTYLGPGTEFLDDAASGEPSPEEIRRIPTGAVALFRGGADGLVHRSPPIAGSGLHRVFLAIDPA